MMNKEQAMALIESESLLKQETKYLASKKEVVSTNQKFGEDIYNSRDEPKVYDILTYDDTSNEIQSDLYVESRFWSKRRSEYIEEPKGDEPKGSFYNATSQNNDLKYENTYEEVMTSKSRYGRSPNRDRKKDISEDDKILQSKFINAKNSKFSGGKRNRFESNKLGTDNKLFKTADDELADIIALKRKQNINLSENELRLKAYYASKLSDKAKTSRKYDASDSDDVIVYNNYKKHHRQNGLHKLANAKYHVDNGVRKLDEYQKRESKDYEEELLDDTIRESKYAVLAPIEAFSNIKRFGKKKDKSNRRYQTDTYEKEEKADVDLIAQDLKTVRKIYLLKKSKDIIFHDEIFNMTKKIVSKIKRIAARNQIGVIIFALALMIFISAIASTGIVIHGISQATGTYLSGLSLSTDFDMTDCENYFTKMEADLQDVVDNIMEYYPGYDRYDLDIDPIGHNSLKLMAYLSAEFENYNLSDIREILDILFNDMYVVNIEEITEIVDNEEILVFKMTIKKTDWDELMSARIQEKNVDLYDSYEENGGGHQSFHSPFDGNWSGKITSPFGWRIHPISGEEKFHNGVDIAMKSGTPIKSCSEGVVVKSYFSDTAGNYVVVMDETGYECHYMHMSSRNVAVGDKVSYDTIIGNVGSTGLSTGPHLHLQVTDQNGEYLNPLFLVQGGY